MRACAVTEKAGVRALPFVVTGFLRQAQATARALGLVGGAMAEYPGLPTNDSPEEMAEKLRGGVLPYVAAWLEETEVTSVAVDEPSQEPEPSPDEIVFRGGLDEVQDHFYERMWTDGLPVVPPTLDRVRRFLACTDRHPDEVIGVLPPERREATVWNIAVNGVMAGCRPEYMPLLIAATEAIADPDFRLEDAGATPGWEALAIVSGPVAQRLDFNSGTGVMRVGRRANSSVGRFVRMVMRNIAGLRIPPGDLDRGSIGASFNVALAEDDAAVKALGWPSFREDQGFPESSSTVTVQSVVATSPPIYCGGSTPEQMLEMLVEIMGPTCGPWSFTGVWYQRWHPLVVLSPHVASRFARAGWTKDHLRAALFEQLQIEARWMDEYSLHVSGSRRTLAELVAIGTAPPRYAESDDPHRLVPMLLRPEWTNIAVAGDPQRNQARVYVNNHAQGPPVTREIRELPA